MAVRWLASKLGPLKTAAVKTVPVLALLIYYSLRSDLNVEDFKSSTSGNRFYSIIFTSFETLSTGFNLFSLGGVCVLEFLEAVLTFLLGVK